MIARKRSQIFVQNERFLFEIIGRSVASGDIATAALFLKRKSEGTFMNHRSLLRGFLSFIFLTGYLVVLSASMTVEAEDQPSFKQNRARMEKNFVTKAYTGGQAEVELSRLAAAKSSSPEPITLRKLPDPEAFISAPLPTRPSAGRPK